LNYTRLSQTTPSGQPAAGLDIILPLQVCRAPQTGLDLINPVYRLVEGGGLLMPTAFALRAVALSATFSALPRLRRTSTGSHPPRQPTSRFHLSAAPGH